MSRPLGQHFLHDPKILSRIVDALEPRPSDCVIEIGPGLGTLTEQLARKVARVVAIERDRGLMRLLQARAGAEPLPGGPRERVGEPLADNVELVEGDALRVDWHALACPPPADSGCTFKVVGNIPYYITSPLIEKALSPPDPEVVVFLMQREVADRVVAPPGSRTYGALSVGVQSVARVEQVFAVRRGSFRPPPNVDSSVIRFRPLDEPLVGPEERRAYRQFVTQVFSQRRKQLRRILRGMWDASEVEPRLGRLGIDPAARPETLQPAMFAALFHSHR